MANTKESKSGGMSLPLFLLVLIALAGIAAGVWLVYKKKADVGRNEKKYTFTMQVGDQKTLEALLEHDYTCASSAEGVVYIAPGTNLLLAKAAGEATVIAKDSVTGASETFVVTVVENPDHPGATVRHTVTTEVTTTTTELTTTETTTVPAGVVSGITLSYYSANVKVGEVHPYALVTMTPADATDKSELWTTSDDKVATVDKAGRITGVGAGKCMIRVTSVSNPFVFAEIEVNVVDPNATSSASESASSTTTATETTMASGESAADSGASSQTGTTASSGGAGQNQPKPTIEVRNGITYVNGILIVNKTYSLPANYNPGLDKNAQAAFNEMQAAAAKEKISLNICSGFRSYTTQKALYDRYCARDGKAEADRYSARPGHSEHQSGLGMDINRASSSFNGTKEAKWLAANCWKYGFIIRYPEGKESITGYMYESWHVRYLGKDLAKKVYDSGLTLEEYLGITSKYAN